MYMNTGYLNHSHMDFKDKSRPLVVGSCGTYRLSSHPKLPTYRPRGRLDYQIIYITAGCGHFHFDNVDNETIVPAGNIVLYRPKELQKYNQNISIDDYAASRGMSVSWFIRNFKKYTGSTPMQFIVGIRINNAQMLLETTTYSINEISKIVGYDNQLYFSRLFHKLKGYSPREYRKIRNKF